MKHTVTRRVATGALSAVLALSSLPAPAIAEAAGRAALAAQAEPQGSWRHDGARWTFALQAGGLATGWQQIGGAWYLFDGAGTMLTGWQNPSGSWYHLSDSGAMTTGWLRWNHAWYWLAPESGRMHQGQWLHEGGEWYYFDGSGAMATGWRQVGGKWYFLQESGAMAHDGYTEDGYYVGPDGAGDESGASDLGLGMAELTTADLLDPAATSAAFTITSDEAHPFAERIGAETVAPVGDMQNFRVTGVERLGTHAVRVSVEGELVDRGELQGAGIYFDKGSFADAEAVGVAGVSVRYAEATLLPEESAYDEQDGTFRLAVDAGSAQLLAGASASVPSDPAIEVQGVEAAGAHKAVVTVRVPGATAYDQLAALSQALHEGGLTVSGTNAGDVAAFLDAEGYDSVLEYLSPSAYFYVERGAGGKGWTLDADGGATVSLRLRMVAESGDFDLTYADLGLVSEGVEDEGWQLVDPNTYEFVAERLSADELAALMAAYGYDDAAEFLDAYAYALGAQVAEGVQLLGGATDEWGIEIPESVTLTLNAFNNVGLGATGEVGDPTLEAQAEETADERIAKKTVAEVKALTALKSISTLTGQVGTVWGNIYGIPQDGSWFMSHAPKPVTFAAVVGGAAVGVLGIVGSSIAAFMTPTGVGIENVMQSIFSAQSKANDISGQLGAISSQISAIRDRLDLATKAGRLTELCSKADSYRPWVVKAMKEADKASDKETFDLMKDDAATSPSGKALMALRDQTKLQSESNGGKMSAYNVAKDLADLIVGDPGSGMKGVVQSYFDYTASKVNWEPEAYHMRTLFVSWVDSAFYNAYTAAMNEAKWDYKEAEFDWEREMILDQIADLYGMANDVANLIGDRSEVTLADKTKGKEGTLLAGTKDRTDGKVLCTVDGRLYRKATSQSDHPAVWHEFNSTSWSSFTNCFDTLFSDPSGPEQANEYTNRSTLSLGNLQTMATRQAFVRTQPGYGGQELKDGSKAPLVSSIYDELIAVGLLKENPTEVAVGRDKTWEKEKDLSWDKSYQFKYAVVGNSRLTNKSNMSGVYHRRWHSADMYDIKSNTYVGALPIFYTETWYWVGHGWRVEAKFQTPVFFQA